MRHSLIIILFFLVSCSSSFNDKQKLDKENIQFITIVKQFDTVALRLTNEQTADFIGNWNEANAKGAYIFIPEYHLTVHFMGDSILSFATSSNLVKQRSDWAYSVGEKDYFKKLWFKQAGLSDNYFEYLPTYNKNGKFSKDRSSFGEKHPLRSSIKQVLTYYNHKWVEIRGQIFYEGKIEDELLWNYTTKANDSVWLSMHK